MRTALVAAIVATSALLLTACSSGPDDATGLSKRRPAGAPPAAGSNEQHDPTDVQGGDGTSNPNANTPPGQPASPGSSTGQIALTLSTATPAVDLGQSVDVMVTLEPKTGFSGDVDLSVTGLPQGATGTFAPAKLTIPAGTTAAVTSKLTLKTAMNTVASAPNTSSALVISAKQGNVEAKANANFKVSPKITLHIPLNVDAMRSAAGTKYVEAWGGPAFGATPTPLLTQQGNGIVVTVINDDTVPHIVHGANGFAHGDTGNPVPPKGTDPKARTLNPGVNCNGYPHDGPNGPSVSFRIQVNAAP